MTGKVTHRAGKAAAAAAVFGFLASPFLIGAVAVLVVLLAVGGGGYSTATTPVGYSCLSSAPISAQTATMSPPAPPRETVEVATDIAAEHIPRTGDQIPYELPASTGSTGVEEIVNAAGQVPSTGKKVTWPHFAALGVEYQNYYLTMRWRYAAWNFDGTAADIDAAQFAWFETGHGGKPWMVTVTNPRTRKAVNLAVIEAGPAPWVGVASSDSNDRRDAAAHGWTNPTRGTPPRWTGIVAGMPPAAIDALDAVTGYPGQNADQLTYTWAADQNATPGPTGPPDPTDHTPVIGCAQMTNGTTCVEAEAHSDLTVEQRANAAAIAEVALSRGTGTAGVVLAIMTAYTESTLNNVAHGDAMGPSSRGLFQQMPSWGSEATRMTPTSAAGLFFDQLEALPDWRSRKPWTVAQTIQGSEFSDGSNYQQNYAVAVAITKTLLGTTSQLTDSWCTSPQAAQVTVNGVTITLPTHANVAEGAAGKTITAPNQAVARGLAEGLKTLGMPYVWGGGTNGGPPDEGCGRGGGSKNSCQGVVGLDCSGLTGYVLMQAGFDAPDNSASQRAAGTDIPWEQGLPGDIIGYPGHVAIYLGHIDGVRYQLEAPDVGMNLRITTIFRQDHDAALHRYWS